MKKSRTTPRFFLILTAVCLLIACISYVSQSIRLQEIQDELSALKEEKDRLESEKQRLEYMIEYAGSDEYLIQFAREKLGYVKKNDIKFSIVDNKEE